MKTFSKISCACLCMVMCLSTCTRVYGDKTNFRFLENWQFGMFETGYFFGTWSLLLGESRGPANSSNPLQSVIVNRVQPHTAFYIGLGMELRSLRLHVSTLLAELYPWCLFCVIIIIVVVVVHWIGTESCYDTHLGLELLDSRVLTSVALKWL